jgi:hypothetical protein
MRTRNRTLAATVTLTLSVALSGLVVGATPGTAQASTCSRSYLPLPDPYCTPGAARGTRAARAARISTPAINPPDPWVAAGAHRERPIA